MKKTVSYIIFTAMLILQLGGCGTEETGPEETEPAYTGTLDGQAVMDLAAQDNSLDAYSAVVNAPLRVEQPKGAINGGGERIFLEASRACFFKKHLFEDVDCWDEIAFVTSEGEAGSAHFSWEEQLWDVAPVAGTDHYATFDRERKGDGESYRYFLTERDEDHKPLREIPLDFLDGADLFEALPVYYALERSGAVHMVWYSGEGRMYQYKLVSPEGESLAEYDQTGFSELVPLYDGRVAFSVSVEIEDEERPGFSQKTLYYMDAGAGGPLLLSDPTTLLNEDYIHYITLFDDSTLLYANYNGVYRSGLSGEDPELLYRWENHGIIMPLVRAMQADGEGRVSLIYQNSGGDACYLCLEPTAEEVEILQLTLAVSPNRKQACQRLAAEFNRQYPGCHIELKDNYDATALLTELGAGKGPVLVDTSLTGFEEKEKLWEPLDTVLGQLGITEELNPSVLEAGKINGTLYGVVTDFGLQTLATALPGIEGWNYDEFLQCIEGRPELEAIFNFYGKDYRSYFIVDLLSHGIDDAYFMDAGETSFGSSGFHRVLELAEKYCINEEGVMPGGLMLEGKVLCNRVTINKPEQLAAYRICYGGNACFVGYPTKEGSTHFIYSASPLALRRTATAEEKAAAAAFLSFCLSYEGQIQASRDVNFGLSVRRDVLEEQIAAMDEWTDVFVPGFDQVKVGDDLDVERDREALLDMIDSARTGGYLPAELENILYEELDSYFSGTITEDMLIDHLENRVGLYLDERK